MKDLFKLKKVKTIVEVEEKINACSSRIHKVEREFIGVITPKYETLNAYSRRETETFLTINPNKYVLITINGQKIEFGLEKTEISTTRVMDKKIRDIIDSLIVQEKERYKIAIETIKLQDKAKILINSFSLKENDSEIEVQNLVKTQNLINPAEFKNKVIDYFGGKVNGRNEFKVSLQFDGFNLNTIVVQKEFDLGHWLKEGDYSFLDFEYDNNMFVCSDYENNQEYQSILKKHFRTVNKTEINKNRLKVETEPYTGDKSSASIVQTLLLSVNTVSKEENLKEVISMVKEMLSLIK